MTVARLGFTDDESGVLHFETATCGEINPLLSERHYLGSIHAARYCFAGWVDNELVACQAWRWPTARMLPADGTWLELARWCLTPEAGKNAGSRMMGWARRWLRQNARGVSTLVSYSDPSVGHTGALYKASGWSYEPTHHGERLDANGVGYPSGHGSWDGVTVQAPKHRWVSTP